MLCSRSFIIAAMIILMGFIVACSRFENKASEDIVFTLYRNSVTEQNERVHIATFDVDKKEDYNKKNCGIAQQLFQNQPGVKVKYWCEKGYFKK
jgi:hypothetical protein